MHKKDIQNNLNEYINILLANQERANSEELKYIFTRKNYYNLLRNVLEVLKENKFATSTTIRLKLLEKSGLRDKVKNFVYNTQITPGLVMEYGTKISKDTIICGNSSEYTLENGKIIPEEKNITYDTIFDLASTSKLFTSLAIYKCVDLGLLDLHIPIKNYVPEFTNLDSITSFDLLTFSKRVITKSRIDNAKNHEEAKQILFSAMPDDTYVNNAYTDIGAMILRIVVERITKVLFQDFVQEEIFNIAKMKDTFLIPPKRKISRCANENFSTIILPNGNSFTRMDNTPGTVHDPKANSIGHDLNIAPGHAGYFSTTPDMIKLGNCLLDDKIISRKSLLNISNNVVGEKRKNSDGSYNYSRYYGSLVYLKQPDPAFLSVYPPLSGKSFMSPGFAGTTFYLDPLNEIFLFIGSNRLHNRIYQIPNSFQNKIKKDENGKMTYTLPDGSKKIVSATFTKDKEMLVKLALDLSIQYQFLELLTQEKKELHLFREI